MVRSTKLGLGTIIRITVDHPDEEEARKSLDFAFGEIDRIGKLMSVYDPSSEISLLNRNGFCEDTSRDLLEVLKKAKYYHELTGGFFDVTMAPVLNARERLSKAGKSKYESHLRKKLSLVGSNGIIIEGRSVRFEKKGMGIDLGAIAKGYAVDAALKCLRDKGIKRAMIDAGGDIKVSGGKSEGRPWRIGLRDPERKRIESLIEIMDYSVATSGTYNRHVNDIINPHNGRPAKGLTRTTVLAENAIDADALSTAVYLLGKDRGLELIEKMNGVEALILVEGGKREKTFGWDEITHFKEWQESRTGNRES